MDYQYLRSIIFFENVTLIILSFYCAYIYSRNIFLEKKSNDEYLLLTKIFPIMVVVFSILFGLMELSFILNFFNRIPIHLYKICTMIGEIILFVLLIISIKKKV